MIASIILLNSCTQAITLSADILSSMSIMTMNSKSVIKPGFSESPTTQLQFMPLIEQTDPSFYFETIGLSVHGAYNYSESILIYGEVGAKQPVGLTYDHDTYLFAHGGLLMTPNTMPFVGLGAAYVTQSGAKIESGLEFTRANADLSSQIDGALFNGYPELEQNNLGINMLSLNLRTGVPLADKFLFYCGMQMGFDMLETNLAYEEGLRSDERSALQEYTDAPVALGNLYGSGVKFSVDSLYIGVRFDITNIYE